MYKGYARVSAMTPKIKVADCKYNTEKICELIEEASKKSAEIVVFPELCITGYTCNDLFLQDTLLDGAIEGLQEIAAFTKNKKGMMVWVGLPYEFGGKLYNVAATLFEGRILGLVPKKIYRIIQSSMKRDILQKEEMKLLKYRLCGRLFHLVIRSFINV